MKVYLLGAANPETIRMIMAVQKSVPNVEFPGFLDNDQTKKIRNFTAILYSEGLILYQN